MTEPLATLPSSAYLICSHQPDGRLERLATRLREQDPDSRIYISHDVRGREAITPRVRRMADRVSFASGGRGDWSTVERQLHMMRLLREDGGADYCTTLSGEDYPARPLVELRATLGVSVDGLLHHFPALDPARSGWKVREARSRYYFRWSRPLPGSKSLPGARTLHLINRLQPFIRLNTAYGGVRLGVRSHGPPGLELYGGSAFFSLSRRAVERVLRYGEEHPEVLDWGRRRIAIDEAYFQTLVLNDPDLQVVNDSGRYFDFSGSRAGHPQYLTPESLDKIVHSGAFFCRKVRSIELMDSLDTRIGSTGRT